MAIEKHVNFFELQKASEKPGCPLCRIVADRADKYIDNTLFEHISDRGFRALYRAAGGFCPYHARSLVSYRDGLAVAILARDILEDRIVFFKRMRLWKPDGRCPVCIESEKFEDEYLEFLCGAGGDSDEEKELREFFTSSDGLCATHYHALLFTRKGRKRNVPGWIKTFQENSFRELKARLDRFIELSSYDKQKEFAALSEKDQLVWKEAAAYLGSKGI